MPMGMPTPYATRKYCTTRNKSAADASRVSFLSLVSPHVQWRCARCPRTRNIPELHPFTMPRSNDKHRIIRHYDVLSPYYRSLWGEHLHHGYWIRGDESKEKAQLQLIEHLARLAKVKPGSDILDIGCGFGKYGMLFREYLDVWHERYERQQWRVRLVGIEAYEQYRNPIQVRRLKFH